MSYLSAGRLCTVSGLKCHYVYYHRNLIFFSIQGDYISLIHSKNLENIVIFET